jgi:Sin3 binding region of histone deacetylase complex subunit SAP30
MRNKGQRVPNWCSLNLEFPSKLTISSPNVVFQVQALRKYTKVYELQGIHPQSSKEELTSAVTRHWNQSVSLAVSNIPSDLAPLFSKKI